MMRAEHQINDSIQKVNQIIRPKIVLHDQLCQPAAIAASACASACLLNSVSKAVASSVRPWATKHSYRGE